jgi:hypothetical protein
VDGTVRIHGSLRLDTLIGSLDYSDAWHAAAGVTGRRRKRKHHGK